MYLNGKICSGIIFEAKFQWQKMNSENSEKIYWLGVGERVELPTADTCKMKKDKLGDLILVLGPVPHYLHSLDIDFSLSFSS